jgi:hypothetical protein
MSGWIEEEFATADFGDVRLEKRLKLVVGRMIDSPMASIKAACRGLKEVMGAYRFFNHPRTSVQTVLHPHRQATVLRVREQAWVLIVQDTSELDYTRKKTLEGAGPLNSRDRRGFYSHNQLVLTTEGLGLGVWNTEIYAREESGFGQGPGRKHRPIEEKESHRWIRGYLDGCDLAEQAPGTEVISCGDREGDIYELFLEREVRLAQGKPAAHWLIRSKEDRKLIGEEDAKQPAKGKKKIASKIRATLRGTPVLGTLQVNIRAKEQWKKGKGGGRKKTTRSARTALLEVRAATVTLKPPARKHRKLPAITLQVVMATEISPPANEEPIEWVLLSSLPVPDFDAAIELIRLYQIRWEIEVFHRVLKTGCRVEELQLKTDDRVRVAIALYMIVAWRVLYLMKLGRECPELPCDVVFEEDEWQAVTVICHGQDALKNKPTLGEFIIQVAVLGGFLARRADGFPGAQAVWQGLTRVRDFTLAWQIFRKNHSGLLCATNTT